MKFGKISLVVAVACFGSCSSFAQSWTLTSAPIANWSSVASSADGTKLVAVSGDNNDVGSIYCSTNSGTTWVLGNVPILSWPSYWSSVASSTDGTKLAAVANHGSIYISADSGETWTETGAPNNTWNGIACSNDGNTLVAIAGNALAGEIYISTNFGTS
jgi:photosystem II stability/assembly factor-like uncharacterized protein